MEKKFVSIVVYMDNCAGEIEAFLSGAVNVIQENFESYEFICVDDACTDESADIVKRFAAGNDIRGMVSVVHMGKYQGIEPSMNAGRDIAIGDFVYEFDQVEMDYPPELIMAAYVKMTEGYDMVSVSPTSGIRFFSRIFYGLYNMSNRGKGRISTDSFRIISRRAINRIKSMGNYIPYRKAVYANCGLETSVITYERDKRKAGKERSYQRVRLAMESFVYFTNFLERVSSIICVFFLLTTVAFVSYSLIDYIVYKNAIEGWTSTICFLSFGFFGMFLMLTIVMKYMSVMLNLMFKRQNYLVSSIEKVGRN